ncbi:MAG: hypothetical protein P3T54_00250 [Dehalogenimonas sp.]|nr:hypothetical protein [Dehalogenimonas sp.]
MRGLRLLARTFVVIAGLAAYWHLAILLIDYGLITDALTAAGVLAGVGGIISYAVRQSVKPEAVETEQEKTKE